MGPQNFQLILFQLEVRAKPGTEYLERPVCPSEGLGKRDYLPCAQLQIYRLVAVYLGSYYHLILADFLANFVTFSLETDPGLKVQPKAS